MHHSVGRWIVRIVTKSLQHEKVPQQHCVEHFGQRFRMLLRCGESVEKLRHRPLPHHIGRYLFQIFIVFLQCGNGEADTNQMHRAPFVVRPIKSYLLAFECQRLALLIRGGEGLENGNIPGYGVGPDRRIDALSGIDNVSRPVSKGPPPMSFPSDQVQINAVAFKEGDLWVVQGVDYDIVAHADDLTKLPNAFIRVLLENIVIAKNLGKEPFEGIKPAPARFRFMYEKAETEMRPINKQKHWPDVSVRVMA
jgi:hypothetical protein